MLRIAVCDDELSFLQSFCDVQYNLMYQSQLFQNRYSHVGLFLLHEHFYYH